jgi:hypothetical protein
MDMNVLTAMMHAKSKNGPKTISDYIDTRPKWQSACYVAESRQVATNSLMRESSVQFKPIKAREKYKLVSCFRGNVVVHRDGVSNLSLANRQIS